MSPLRKPHLGAIVMLVDPHMGDKYPGLVTRVMNNGTSVYCTTFQVNQPPFPLQVPFAFNLDAKVKSTWHWPEIPDEPC